MFDKPTFAKQLIKQNHLKKLEKYSKMQMYTNKSSTSAFFYCLRQQGSGAPDSNL